MAATNQPKPRRSAGKAGHSDDEERGRDGALRLDTEHVNEDWHGQHRAATAEEPKRQADEHGQHSRQEQDGHSAFGGVPSSAVGWNRLIGIDR